MQSPTSHYQNLKKSLDSLNPLVRSVDPIGCRTNLQFLKLQSYILLSHAIFEEYLEQLAKEVASEARQKLRNENMISKALLGLIACGIVDEIDPKKSNRKIIEKTFRDIADFSSTAYNGFVNVIDTNNGIKTENQKKLLLPIGLDPARCDPATMAALDAFGTARGGIAHSFKIKREHTLSQVQSEINQITSGLISFDEAACETLSTTMAIS